MESQPLSVGSAGNGLSAQPNPSFNSHRQLLIPLLLAKYEGRSKPWLDGKRKAQHEVELLSQTLGIGLLQHIRNTLLDASEGKQRASQVGHTDYDMGNVCSTVQALQTKLQATEDEDEQRALEEDITGKILQFYLCGIYAEVDQLLPKVVDHIRNGLDSKMIPKDRIRSDLREIADMIKGTRRTDMNHETAHLWRIMLDSGAGVSKHKLWLAARDAEQARRLRFSGGGSILSTHDNASSTSAEVSSTSTVQQVVAPGDGGR
ncbi:hypothetical protein EV401DRAFT_342549 [Pisolithus croceorrhizus]|nr:hypothetical protein EV401DRAFT_342549 [Pisolithus croceorrhizus]